MTERIEPDNLDIVPKPTRIIRFLNTTSFGRWYLKKVSEHRESSLISIVRQTEDQSNISQKQELERLFRAAVDHTISVQ